jgi:hypothetical protein
VIQWATGTTGSLALRAVIDAPDLDAGELAGGGPVGVEASDDEDALLALRADVALYMGSVEKHPDECLADVVALLSSGTDVITTGSSFIDTFAVNPAWGHAIENACRHGASSFSASVFPGVLG